MSCLTGLSDQTELKKPVAIEMNVSPLSACTPKSLPASPVFTEPPASSAHGQTLRTLSSLIFALFMQRHPPTLPHRPPTLSTSTSFCFCSRGRSVRLPHSIFSRFPLERLTPRPTKGFIWVDKIGRAATVLANEKVPRVFHVRTYSFVSHSIPVVRNW